MPENDIFKQVPIVKVGGNSSESGVKKSIFDKVPIVPVQKKKDGGAESSNTQLDATTPTSTELKPSQSSLPKDIKPVVPQKIDLTNTHTGMLDRNKKLIEGSSMEIYSAAQRLNVPKSQVDETVKKASNGDEIALKEISGYLSYKDAVLDLKQPQSVGDNTRQSNLMPPNLKVAQKVQPTNPNAVQDIQHQEKSDTQKKLVEVNNNIQNIKVHKSTKSHIEAATKDGKELDYRTLGENIDKEFNGKNEIEDLALTSKAHSVAVSKISDYKSLRQDQLGLSSAANYYYDEYANAYNKYLDTGSEEDKAIAQGLAQKVTSINQKMDNVYDAHPYAGIDAIATIIGNHIAQKKGNYMMYVSNKDVADAFSELKKDNPEIEKYSKQEQQLEVDPSQVPVLGQFRGLTGGLLRGAVGLMKSADQGLSKLMGLETKGDAAAQDLMFNLTPRWKGTSFTSDESDKLVLDKNGKTFKKVKNTDANFINRTMNNLGGAAPVMAAFIVTEGVVGSALAGAEEVAAAFKYGKAISAGANLGESAAVLGGEAKILSAGTSEYLKLAGAQYATSYVENSKFADSNIKEEGTVGDFKRALTSNTLTLLQAGIFKGMGTSPTKLLMKSFNEEIGVEVTKAIEAIQGGQIAKSELQPILEKAVSSKMDRFLKSAGTVAKEATKMGIINDLNIVANDVIGSILNPKKQSATAEQYAQSFQDGAILGGFMGGIGEMFKSGSLPGSLKDPNKTQSQVFWDLGRFSEKYISRLEKGAEDGLYTRDEANTKIATIKTLRDITDRVGGKVVDGQMVGELTYDDTDMPLSQEHKEKYATLELRERVAQKILKENPNLITVEKDRLNKTIEETRTEQSNILKDYESTYKEVDENAPDEAVAVPKGEEIPPVSDTSTPDVKEVSAVDVPDEQPKADNPALKEPSKEQQTKDALDGNLVTFTYKSDAEVPEIFKDKISSRGETNGETIIRVTIPKSLADYHLAKSESLLSKEQPTLEAKDKVVGSGVGGDVETFELHENEGKWKATTKTYRGRETGNWVFGLLDKKQNSEYEKIKDEADSYGTKEQAEANLKKLQDFEIKNKEAFVKAKEQIDNFKQAEEKENKDKADRQKINNKTANQLSELSDSDFEKLINLIDKDVKSTLEKRFGDRIERKPLFSNRIAEDYHKAKADGSNPELVKAVESLLNKEQDIKDSDNIVTVPQTPNNEKSDSKETNANAETKEEGSKESNVVKIAPELESEGAITSDAGNGGSEPPTVDGMPKMSPKDADAISMSNSIVNYQRIQEGMHELVSEGSRSFQSAWDDLMDRITGSERFKPRDFVQYKYDEFKKGRKIAFTDDDEVAWYFDQVDLTNEKKRLENEYAESVKSNLDNADKIGIQDNLNSINNKIQQSQELARHVGTIGARTLAFRRNVVELNKVNADWSSQFRREYGNYMPTSMYEGIKVAESEFRKTNNDLSSHYKEIYDKAFEEAYQKAKKELGTPRQSTQIKKTKEFTNKLRERAALISESEAWDKLGLGNPKGGQAMGVDVNVKELVSKGLVKIADGIDKGVELAEIISKTISELVESTGLKEEDLRNAVGKFLTSNGFSEKEVSAAPKRESILAELKQIKKSESAKRLSSEMMRPLRDLVNSHIKNNPEANSSDIIKMSANDLKELFPAITEKEIREAYSGLGVKEETKQEVQSNVSKFKSMMKDVNDFTDLSSPKTEETPKEELNRLSKLRQRFDKIKPYLDELGISVEPPTGYDSEQKARAYEASKSVSKSIIESIKSEQERLKDLKKLSGSNDNDARIEMLGKEREKISEQISEIEKSKASDEEKVKKTRQVIENQIANYKGQSKRYKSDNILKDKNSDAYRENKDLATSADERAKSLSQHLKELDEQADPFVSPEEKAISRLNTQVEKSIIKWENKLQKREFKQKNKDPKEIGLEKGNTPKELMYGRDKKTIELELKAKRAENNYYALRKVAELSKQGIFRKVISMLTALKRSFVLSRLSTFVKLTGAASENIVMAIPETAMGYANYGLSKVHLISPKLIDKAQRFGVPTLQGEVDALAVFGKKETWSNFIKNIQGKPDDLSMLYSGGSDYDFIGNIPKEYRDNWMRIENALEIPARGHGGIKGLAKKSEYMRSFVTRMENVKRIYGEDVARDPLMQQLVGTLAYSDGKRSILMEDNMLSKFYQRQIKSLQKGGVVENIVALGLAELMPVVTVPTNMALMTARATLGLPLSGAEIAFRSVVEMVNGNSKLGISQLSPEKADALLRNLRKGEVGMALMMAGFFAPNMFGASPIKTKGTEEQSGLEEGEVKLFGLEVPKLFVDNPYLVTMRIGATVGQLYEKYKKDDYNSLVAGMIAASKTGYVYATNDLPLIQQPINAVKAGEALITGRKNMNWWLYGQVKATIEPGAMQNIAEIQDSEDWWKGVIGKGNKRKPRGLGETLQTGVPNIFGLNPETNRQQIQKK